jgi:hypothetical protein
VDEMKNILYLIKKRGYVKIMQRAKSGLLSG